MFSWILTMIISSLPLLTKNPLIITPVPSTLKVNAPSNIKKKAIINNLISHAKLISSKTIFYKEIENIKWALINNGFPNYIVDEQIKCMTNIYHTFLLQPNARQLWIRFMNQFLLNIIRSIWQFKSINKKVCTQKMSMFNQMCVCVYIYIYIYIYIYT